MCIFGVDPASPNLLGPLDKPVPYRYVQWRQSKWLPQTTTPTDEGIEVDKTILSLPRLPVFYTN
jgi:hypothetical protein